MTDNSDFMSRYLRPENADRRSHPDPAAGDAGDVWIQSPQMPKPAAPQPPRLSASEDEFAPTPSVEHQDDSASVQPRAAVPPSNTGPQTGNPVPGSERSAPVSGRQEAHPPTGNDDAGHGQVPAPIPPPPVFDQPNPAPNPAERWAPAVDPAQRWAPRADPRVGAPHADRHIQVREVVKKRREPAEIGWRKAVYAASGGLVNFGAGPEERNLRDWKAQIMANIPGNYQIAVVSVKGGVGKTRLTAGVGTVFADMRKQPVIAIDADTTYGSLGRFVDPEALTCIREFLGDTNLVDYPKARKYTGQNKQGLEVLAGNQNVANPLDFTTTTFFDTVSRTRHFYQLQLVDCGADIEQDIFKAVLSASDALMIVGSCNVEGGLAVETTIDWLASRNGHELLKRSVIVLNDGYRCVNKNFVTHVTQALGKRVHSVKTVPWDPHLRDADTLDFPALRKRTQLALIELAAELAGGFPTAGALAE